MNSEVALKACARELLAAEFEAAGQAAIALAVRTFREDGPRSHTHTYARALRAIEKALTRASGWQDARAEAFEEAAGEAESVGAYAVAKLIRALKPLPSSPSGEGGCE